MTIALSFDGFVFEFANKAAMRKFAKRPKDVATGVIEAIERGPNMNGVYEATLRTPIRESAKSTPLHEMTDQEFSQYASRVFTEALTGARAGKPVKETRKRKVKENSKPRVKESESDTEATAAVPEIDANGLFVAMGDAHAQRWGRGVGGTYSLSDFAKGYTSNDAPVIRLPGITPDGGV